MADVRNFVIPESDLSGLNRVTNTYERKNVREAEVQRQQSAKKSASAAFLTNYLNPNDNLTGTPYDPQIVKGFDELLQQGTKLASEGADTNMMMMALSPGVAKLNQYSATAKLIDKRIKDQLAQVPANAGYNRLKLEEFAKKGAFYDNEGKLKDIKSIDPSVDYLTEAIKLHPAEVTTDAAIDEFVKTSPKFTNTQSVKRINSRGGYEMKKAEVTAPSWATVDEEGSIVPRYNIALEGGKPHSFNFQTGEGTTKEAEIRLMDEKDFDSLMGSNPGIADWVRGQVMRAGQGADLNSPQAKNAARAIMYDELKRRGGGGIKDIEETKEAPAPRISIRNYSGGGTPKKDEGANWVKRATAAINEDNPVDIEDTFGELFKGNNAPYVGIKKNGDNFTVTYKDKQGYEATEDFNVKDRQLPNKLARLYQMIMGSDVKMEKGDYGTQDVPVMPKNDNPKGKGGWKPFSKKNTTITPTKDNPLGLDL